MKKVWIVAAILIAVGFVLATFGVLAGAKNGVYFDREGIHILEREKNRITESDLGAFTNIEINADYSKVEIIEGNNYEIDILGNDNVTWKIENGTLQIDCTDKGRITFFNLNFADLFKDNREYVKVYVPREAAINRVDVKVDAGSIVVNNIITESIDIKASYGSVNLASVRAEKMNIKADCGKVELNKCDVRDINISNNFGEIIVDDIIAGTTTVKADHGRVVLSGNFEYDTRITCDYGDINFSTVQLQEYYNVKISVDFGKIKLNNQNLGGGSVYSGNAEGKLLEIHADCGDVKVNFK